MKNYYDKITKQMVTEPTDVEECLLFIKMLGFDYNGYTSADDLKKLIDEFVSYAEKGLDFLRKD